MSKFGSTHLKKSDLKKKSIVKYELQLATAEEKYGIIIKPDGSLRFIVKFEDGTEVRAKAGNTFRISKRNPKGERINIGSLVKVDCYLNKNIINHIYTKDDEEELKRRGLLDNNITSNIDNNNIIQDDIIIDDNTWLNL